MNRLEGLLKKAEEEHRKFEIEQYREILERIIPPMLEEFKYNSCPRTRFHYLTQSHSLASNTHTLLIVTVNWDGNYSQRVQHRAV
jgi:hypothetical protein